MLRASMRRLAAIPFLLALVLTACGDSDESTAGPDRVTVVATTTQAADLVRSVGGDRVEVERLLDPNTDPHDYEVRPGDVKRLTDAGVAIRSGGEVDEWLGEAIEASGTDAPVVDLADAVGRGEADPHWWQDPRNARLAVEAIERALTRVDPAGAEAFKANAAAYVSKLERLDAAIAACWEGVAPAQRKLVTTHDALGSYADRYGLEVVGTVIPSRSTQGQPSAGETAELVETIRAQGVKAIFAESSVDPKVEAAIAREAGAKVGKALWADSLGPAGSDGATYLDSLASNTRGMVDGLTGGAVRCRLPAG